MVVKTSLATITGTMLVPGVSRNNRLYTKPAIGRAVERMRTRLGDPDGLPIVMRTHHDAGDDSRQIVGRIVDVRQEADGSAVYKAKLYNNKSGRDLAPLITPDPEDGKVALRTTSIHGYWVGPTERLRQGSGPVETGEDLEINAIDFTYSPGVTGAQISSVTFESTNVAWPISGANVHDGHNIFESMEASFTMDVEPYDEDGYPVGESGYNTAQRKSMAAKGQAMAGGRYPVANKSDLRKAIRAVGRGSGSHDVIRKHIINRAKALGLSGMIPSNWSGSGASKETVVTVQLDGKTLFENMAGIAAFYKARHGDVAEHYIEVCVGDGNGEQIKICADNLSPDVLKKAIKGAGGVVKQIMSNNPDDTTMDDVDSDDMITDPDDIQYRVVMAPQIDTTDPNMTQDNGGYNSTMAKSESTDSNKTSIKEAAMADEITTATAAPAVEAIDYNKLAVTIAETMARMDEAKAVKKAAKKAAKAQESTKAAKDAVTETNKVGTEVVTETITPEQLDKKLADERAKTVAELRESILATNGIPQRKGYRGVNENEDGAELTGDALWDKRGDVWAGAYPGFFGVPAA